MSTADIVTTIVTQDGPTYVVHASWHAYGHAFTGPSARARARHFAIDLLVWRPTAGLDDRAELGAAGVIAAGVTAIRDALIAGIRGTLADVDVPPATRVELEAELTILTNQQEQTP